MKVRTVVPQLRFPEFSEGLSTSSLGDIANFSKGVGISKDDIVEVGKFKAIRYGELYTTYSEIIHQVVSSTSLPSSSLVFSKTGDVIIPASGETAVDIATASCVLEEGIALGGDINIIRSSNNGVFLAYYLNNARKFDISRLAQGVSVMHLYKSGLQELVLNLPSLDEQEKIAEFLSAIDERVNAQKKKVELLKQYKKGMMQKIFSQKIRFKDENGNDYPDWEEKKFDDVLSSVATKKYQIQSSEYSVTGRYPVVDQGQKDVIGYTDDAARLFQAVPVIVFGDHTTFLKYVNNPFVVGADGAKLLTAAGGNVLGYIFYFLQNSQIEPEGYRRHFGVLKNIKIQTPSVKEQQKIADHLTSIDDKINAEEAKLSEAKNFKKALLQRMFV